MAQTGLVIIAVAWLVQLFFSLKGKNDIRPEFIASYLVGVGFLIASYIQGNSWDAMSYFELSTFIAALIVLVNRIKK
ncbi:MAG: hypothetical protein V1886_00505 [archaeon]